MEGLRKLIAIAIIAYVLASNGVIGQFGGGSLVPGINKVAIDGAYFVIVEETESRPAFVSRLKTDSGLWDQLASLGVSHRFIDVDSPNADSYRTKAMEIGLPAYFFINGNSKLISSGSLPDGHEQILKIVKQEA